MRINSSGAYQVEISVFVRGLRVQDECYACHTTVRHPAQIVAQATQDYKKLYMNRDEVRKAAIRADEVKIQGQLIYT